MKYRYSKVDNDNIKWFANDMSKATLSEIELRKGILRGLHPFHLIFNYPISVIAGQNGSGKSTILALAACAFHNKKDGFHLSDRHATYYTFSDFFIQTAEETPPEGIQILYRFRHDKWNPTKRAPSGVGNLFQTKEKAKGGKWNKYANRVKRNVVFLGIQRVVPHSEKSISRSYRAYFRDGTADGWEDDVKKAVGKILGTPYDSFWLKTHSKYKMPLVASRGNIYSGFNMGAGENALFGIFTTIYASPPGTLLVIDEIELGLHEKAQRKLLQELKEICRSRQVQVICTTHSSAILESVPPEGRFYIESFSNKTIITPGISVQYAAGKMSGEKSKELDIFVEDGIANIIIEAVLDNELRNRVDILPIGSPMAISRQMAARYKEKRLSDCIAILDGDQSSLSSTHLDNFMKALEAIRDKSMEEQWFNERLLYLPGDTWPEKWMVDQLLKLDIRDLANLLKCSVDELTAFLEEAKTAGKHNELYSLGKSLSLDAGHLTNTIARWLAAANNAEFSQLLAAINETLQ